MSKEKILIVGGGFAGVKAALELADDDRFAVTLLSDQQYFKYYPALYHTATGGRYANSWISLQQIFKHKKITIAQDRATTIDRKAKIVGTESGATYSYDSVILALGVVTNYFGIEGLEEFSYGIKSITEVERLKAHLHQQLIDDHKPDLNYVIVGAGPTGIELAGALPMYLRHIMKLHGIKDRKVHIDLIEAAPRLLPRMARETSRSVQRRLKRLGVKLYVGQAVQAASADELTVKGKSIRSHTIIWTAGVTNHPFFKDNNFSMTPHGKVWVDSYLQAEDDVFIAGDNANTVHSGLAQTAAHDGAFIAQNLKRRASGWNMKSYKPKLPITVIPAGPHWAVVTWGHFHIYGWLGWVLRELGDLVGFHDVEGTWYKATEQWFTEFGHEEACTTCTAPDKK